VTAHVTRSDMHHVTFVGIATVRRADVRAIDIIIGPLP
jgi:hypothetical protein